MKNTFIIFFFFCITGTAQLVPFEFDERYGYKDENGKIIIKAKYQQALEFLETEIAAVVFKNKWWYINVKGKKLISPYIVDNGPDNFSEGLARFGKDGKMGFFDHFGKKMIKAKLNYAEPFSGGFAQFNVGGTYQMEGEYNMLKGGKWGFIDRDGKVVVVAIYDYTGPFEKGIAWVKLGDKEYYIDASGKEIPKEKADSILNTEEFIFPE